MDKVRFGLVGTGRITDWVLKGAFEDPRFVAQAVCSRSIDSARTFAAKYNIPEIYTDLEQMVSSPDIDAVYIGTPNHTHADIAIKCLNHGKHVLCEKPFASNANEAQRMVSAARENGVIIMEAMISTLSPNFRKACDLVSRIGTLRNYSATFCQYSSKYDALKQGVVAASFDPLCSGGALMDIGVYTIWPMVALFGPPSGISSNVMAYDIPGHGVTDLQGTVDFKYDGFNASVIYSKISDSYLPTEIAGEEGNIILDKIHVCKDLKFIPHAQPSSGRGTQLIVENHTVEDDNDTYYHEFKEFIDCVQRGEESNINSPDRSIIVMKILDQVRSALGS
jgi:predicted dehydrogenase